MNLDILPLAITMMAGPQIMSAIIFLTASKPVKLSASFIAGVADRHHRGRRHRPRSRLSPRQQHLAGRLLRRGIDRPHNPVRARRLAGRSGGEELRGPRDGEPPSWLGTLQSADSRKALTTGLLVILLMPSDLIIMLTVGVNLVQNNGGLIAALPFIAATVLVAALPLLLYLLFYRRAQRVMPKVRDWMNANSWLVNIIVCGVFILLILS